MKKMFIKIENVHLRGFKLRWFKFLIVALVVLFICNSIAFAAGQSSANYTIENDVISGGGGNASSSNYSVEHTTGQSSAIGISSSSNFTNHGGFWYAAPPVVPLAGFLGDINMDSTVDISDVILALRMALQLDTPVRCADINYDQGSEINVDISDVILTLRMALGLDRLIVCT